MKTVRILFVALFLGLSVGHFGCKSTAGEVGPAGPAGPAGPTGNANVTQINYAGRSVTGSFTLNLTGVNTDRLNNSAVFCYMLASNGIWYQLPGFTSGGTYEYRTFTSPATVSTLTVSRVTAGTGTDTFVSLRVLVIQASSVINGRKSALDFSNYEEVKRFYNLPD